MKVLSIIMSFPENSVLVPRFIALKDNSEIDYRVFCWKSSKWSWKFWGEALNYKTDRKKVLVSFLSKGFRDLIFFLACVIGFLYAIFHPSFFIRFLKLTKNLSISKRFVYYISDLKIFFFRPDIIHFEYGSLSIDKLYLKELLPARIIVSFRGYDINYFKLEVDQAYDDVWKHADGFHFLGQDLLERAILRGFNKKPDQKVKLIPPAVNSETFSRRSKHSLKNNFINILSIGRLVWKKAIPNGLLAFKHFLDIGGDGIYHIVGDGNAFEECNFIAYELGITNKVKFHGKTSPKLVKEILEITDVYFHPAISEGFCNSVMEAQSMEIPVVCSNADGLGENIENNVTGFVIDKWNTGEMGNKLYDLMIAPDIRIQFGQKGRERVISRYNFKVHGMSFLEFYKEFSH